MKLSEQNALSINKYMDQHSNICRLTKENEEAWGELAVEFIRYLSERVKIYKDLYLREKEKNTREKDFA